MAGEARDVTVADHYAYVALYEAGLVMFDVSSPTNCVRTGGYDTSGNAMSVAVSGSFACVADDTNGL